MVSRYEEIMKTKPYLPFDMGGCLTEALIAKAQEELGETEEVKAKTIPELRQLVQAEPDLVCPTDDSYMLQYLRTRKFNVQRAFSLLKNFYSVKKSNDDIYGSFDKEALMRAFGLKSSFNLPYRDEEGCAIEVIQMRKWDVDVMNAPEAIVALTTNVMLAVQEPATQICGMRVLIDVRGTNMKQIRSLIPRYARLLSQSIINCMPVRFKGIHLYNESPIFQYVFSIYKLFLNAKMKNRIHLHGDSQDHLYKFIPKAILPTEGFGGDNPDDVAAWHITKVEKNFEYLRQLTTYGYRQ